MILCRNVLIYFRQEAASQALTHLASAMSPLGYLLSYGIKVNELGDINQYFDRIMAVVIGIFLHISTTILFESSNKDHQYNRKKLIAVLLGVAVSLANFLFH